jgi:hypothetical protein
LVLGTSGLRSYEVIYLLSILWIYLLSIYYICVVQTTVRYLSILTYLTGLGFRHSRQSCCRSKPIYLVYSLLSRPRGQGAPRFSHVSDPSPISVHFTAQAALYPHTQQLLTKPSTTPRTHTGADPAVRFRPVERRSMDILSGTFYFRSNNDVDAFVLQGRSPIGQCS